MYSPKLKKILAWTLAGLGILYVGWNGRSMLLGPRVSVAFPHNGESFDTKLVSVAGKAQNTSRLTLNDREIYVDTAGYFSEKIALLPGLNTIKISSKDRFGDSKEELLHVYFKGSDLDYSNL